MGIPVSNNDYNTAIGFGALDVLTQGNYNCFIGSKADGSFGHTTGSYNVHVGGTVGANNVDYSDNVVISGDASNIFPPIADLTVIGNTIVGNTNLFSNTSAPVTIVGYNNNNGAAVGPFSGITIFGPNNVVTASSVINIGAGNNITFPNNIVIGDGITPVAANSIVIGDASHTSVIIGGVALVSGGASILPSLIVGDAGTEGTGINIGGVNYDALFKVSDISSADIAQSIIHRHSTTWEPIQVFARSNSNGSGHGVVTNGMLLSSQYTAGWTGTEYNLFGRASFQASATGTISDASSPGDFVIATTPDGATLPVEAVRIKSDKSAVFAGGVSYASSTFAALPAASGATNQIYFVSDIGPDGSLWKSNGTEWKPVNGKCLLLRGNYPVGMPNNGSVGANGALTLTGTGLVNVYDAGTWLYFPAGAVFAGSAAGFYWTVMSSATVGTIYNSTLDPNTTFLPAVAGTLTPIVSAAIGAFLAVGTQTLASIYNLPAGILGAQGSLEGIISSTFTSSASTKTISVSGGLGTLNLNTVSATTTNSANGYINTRNRTANRQVNNVTGLIQTPTTGGTTFTSVNTTVSQPVYFVLTNNGPNNDHVHIESVEIFLCK